MFVLNRTTFNTLSLNEDWKMTGIGFSLFGDGLQSNPVGSWKTLAMWDKYITLDRSITKIRLTVNYPESIFCIIRKYPDWIGFGGTIGEVDFKNQKLKFYQMWTSEKTPPDLCKQISIKPNFFQSQEYEVSLGKTDGLTTLTLQNLNTNEFVTLENDNGLSLESSKYTGKQIGSPGILFLEGNILIKQFEFISPISKFPTIAVLGDSLVEGESLRGKPNDYDNRWCAKLFEKFGGNVLISGRGGENSSGILKRLEVDVGLFKPKIVLLLIGLGDFNYEQFCLNYDAIIEYILNNKAIPILCTIPPRPEHSFHFREAVNNKIKSYNLPIIHIDKVLSQNNDGHTVNPLLVEDDLIHPNVLGHQLMYEQLFLDVPQLFFS